MDVSRDTLAFGDEEWNRYRGGMVVESEREVQITVFEFCRVVKEEERVLIKVRKKRGDFSVSCFAHFGSEGGLIYLIC